MPYFIRLFAILLLACLGSTAHAERLRIVSDDWAPYIHFEAGEPKGMHVEVANEVFRRLGIEVQWQFMPWRRCLAMVERGLADGVMDVFRSGPRRQYIVYPDEPMSSVDFVLFQARARPHRVRRLEDLAGLVVGVSPGYDHGKAFEQSTLFRREPAPTLQANFGKLMLGRIDLLVTDRRAGHHALHALGLQDAVQMLPWRVNQRPQYLGLRLEPGREQLAQRFAEELRRFKREPAFQAIDARHAVAMDFPDAVEQQESGTLR